MLLLLLSYLATAEATNSTSAAAPDWASSAEWTIVSLFVNTTCSSALMDADKAARFILDHLVRANRRRHRQTTRHCWTLA